MRARTTEERLPDTIDLVATIKGDVIRSDFPVQSQIASRSPLEQRQSAQSDLGDRSHRRSKAEIDVGQPFALDLTQIVKCPYKGTRHESSL